MRDVAFEAQGVGGAAQGIGDEVPFVRVAEKVVSGQLSLDSAASAGSGVSSRTFRELAREAPDQVLLFLGQLDLNRSRLNRLRRVGHADLRSELPR